jgi:hypothetical protein
VTGWRGGVIAVIAVMSADATVVIADEWVATRICKPAFTASN